MRTIPKDPLTIVYPFPADRFGEHLAEVTAQANRSGALQPIQTRTEYVEDQGIKFLVRVVSSLARKPSPRMARDAAQNPFLPYDPALYVADVSPTHLCLLNKFPVVQGHVLVVTRSYAPQTSPLTAEDFGALWRCLSELDCLGFYNSGTAAGASQNHKHLQLVPLPLDDRCPVLPVTPLLPNRPRHSPTRLRALPFEHRFVGLEPSAAQADGSRTLAAAYQVLVARMELQRAGTLAPYNLLLTRDWMLIVPRSAECFHGISLNALAFAGALLVKNDEQFDLLRQRGPSAALRAVSG